MWIFVACGPYFFSGTDGNGEYWPAQTLRFCLQSPRRQPLLYRPLPPPQSKWQHLHQGCPQYSPSPFFFFFFFFFFSFSLLLPQCDSLVSGAPCSCPCRQVAKGGHRHSGRSSPASTTSHSTTSSQPQPAYAQVDTLPSVHPMESLRAFYMFPLSVTLPCSPSQIICEARCSACAKILHPNLLLCPGKGTGVGRSTPWGQISFVAVVSPSIHDLLPAYHTLSHYACVFGCAFAFFADLQGIR